MPLSTERTQFDVSIHARRVTGDTQELIKREAVRVSIHARRVTGDGDTQYTYRMGQFQFTPVV